MISRMRHVSEDELLTRGYAVTHPSGAVVLPTEPGWSQLLYAASGVMRVETGAEVWVVPPHRALWLPDGARARIVMHGRVAVRTLYLRDPSVLPPSTVAVDVSPLLRELVLHAVRISPLLRDRAEHRRLVATLADQLSAAPHTPLLLPAPSDLRAVALTRAFEADPATQVPLSRLAAEVGASRRTLERLFVLDTGMTIGQWRQRLRLVRALEMLAAGDPVTTVAAAVGYATPSAFTAMFRAQLGAPPGRYLSPGRRGASAGARPR
jgi:AraC-like DNA-binding protein